MRRTVGRILLFGALLLTVSFVVLMANQTVQLADLAARVHPMAGQGVFWALAFIYTACLLVPLFLFLRLPKPLIPPESEDSPEFRKHLQGLAKRLTLNPRLQGTPLASRADVEAALSSLDDASNEAIKSAGSRVFFATAISQFGALDAMLVLGVQSKLIWDVSHVYYQRPTIRDMVYLYANVMSTAFLATELDDADLSEQIQPVLTSVLGSAAGVVPGLQAATALFVNSVVSGTANAYLTLRVGIIAREYSRALVRPRKAALRKSAVVQAAGMLGSIAATGAARLSGVIVKASGRTVTGAVAGIGGKIKDAGGAVLDRLTPGKGPEPEGAGGA